MTLRTFTVLLGSLELTARAEVTGEFRPAVTQADPEFCYPAEEPEIYVLELRLASTALTGLLDDEDIWSSVQEQILGQLAEAAREGDPDAGDKWRDRQMERKA